MTNLVIRLAIYAINRFTGPSDRLDCKRLALDPKFDPLDLDGDAVRLVLLGARQQDGAYDCDTTESNGGELRFVSMFHRRLISFEN